MANKRELKKDIQTLIEMVISDALELSLSLEKEEDQKKVLDLIVKTAGLHNDLIARVNHPDGKENPKIVKKHFQQIKKDLLEGCDSAYNELNAILPK